jgi:hypothetical protein
VRYNNKTEKENILYPALPNSHDLKNIFWQAVEYSFVFGGIKGKVPSYQGFWYGFKIQQTMFLANILKLVTWRTLLLNAKLLQCYS